MRSIMRFVGVAVLALAPAFAFAGNVGGSEGTVGDVGESQFTVDEMVLSAIHLSNRAEVSDAALAGRNSASPRVKAYAKRLAKDHALADRRVKRLARELGVAMNNVIGLSSHLQGKLSLHRQQQAAMSQLTGSAFDVAFLRHAVEDHRQAIEQLEAALPSISNERLKALVEKLLPVLKRHQARGQRLLDSFEG
jgi:putative membrane protein